MSQRRGMEETAQNIPSIPVRVLMLTEVIGTMRNFVLILYDVLSASSSLVNSDLTVISDIELTHTPYHVTLCDKFHHHTYYP